jgi:hypothetical protein
MAIVVRGDDDSRPPAILLERIRFEPIGDEAAIGKLAGSRKDRRRCRRLGRDRERRARRHPRQAIRE